MYFHGACNSLFSDAGGILLDCRWKVRRPGTWYQSSIGSDVGSIKIRAEADRTIRPIHVYHRITWRLMMCKPLTPVLFLSCSCTEYLRACAIFPRLKEASGGLLGEPLCVTLMQDSTLYLRQRAYKSSLHSQGNIAIYDVLLLTHS